MTKCLIDFFIDWTALSAAPLDHGEAVEHGKKLIFRGFINLRNSTEFAIPVSLSHRKYFGIPKGAIIVLLTALISSEVCLDFKGCNWMYPVNISTAKNIAVWPFNVVVKDGIMSVAHVTLGAKTISIFFRIWACGVEAFNWHCMQESVKFFIYLFNVGRWQKYFFIISLLILDFEECRPIIV